MRLVWLIYVDDVYFTNDLILLYCYFWSLLFFSVLDDWRCDSYRWINQGVTKLPRKEPTLKKMYFDCDTPNGPSKDFQRQAYQLIGDRKYTLIHYLGDETTTVDFCHGNSKRTKHQPFIRTCPSQMKKFKELTVTNKANVVYKREIASLNCDAEQVPVKAPRNMHQLRNIRYRQLHRLRLSRDDLYNLHEIAFDIPGFTRKITTFPDLVCVCGLQVSGMLIITCTILCKVVCEVL